MAKPQFQHKVRYVEPDMGQVIVLPDELDLHQIDLRISSIKSILDSRQAALTEAEAEIKKAAKDAGKETPADVAGSIPQLVRGVQEAQQMLDQTTAARTAMQQRLDEYGAKAKEIVCLMHCFGYLEQQHAVDAGKLPQGGSSEGVITTHLLAKCIDTWTLKDPINPDTVGALAPAIVENLKRTLLYWSQPTLDSLDERAIGAAHAG